LNVHYVDVRDPKYNLQAQDHVPEASEFLEINLQLSRLLALHPDPETFELESKVNEHKEAPCEEKGDEEPDPIR
jgi:hypothetical protein